METLKRELDHGANADLRQHLVGMFIFCDRRDPEGSAVICANVNTEAVAALCKGVLRQLGKDPASRIINPFDRSN
jgi:hypothetical protein